VMNISRSNREEIENEFMALLLNQEKLLDSIQVKPKYLFKKENQILLQQLLTCWEKNHLINFAELVKIDKNFDFDYYFERRDNTFYYNNASEKQLKLSEESIIKFFKEDIIKDLNNRLNQGQMTYDEFILKMKKLDDIKIVDEIDELTEDEILNNIDEQKTIEFHKFKKMSYKLKLAQNDLLVIGSMTGTGKTGFMLNLMSDLMENYQCVYFNMEMSKSSIYKRIVAINSGIPVDNINNPETEYQKQIIKNSIKKIAEAGVVIEHRINDIKQIKLMINKIKKRNKHTIIFIDHLGLTKLSGKTSLYEQMTEIMKTLREICLDYDCTIIGASQLNRSAYTSEELSVSMLKDSGELENSARKIILLYRDKESAKEDLNPTMNIDICKNDSGATGKIQMIYHKVKQIFEEK